MLAATPEHSAFFSLFLREAAVFAVASMIIWGRSKKRSEGDTTNLAQRFTTFLLIVLLANVCAYFGGIAFAAMIFALQFICIKEYMDLLSVKGAMRFASYVFAFLFALLAGLPSITVSFGGVSGLPVFYLVPLLILLVVPLMPVFLQRFQGMFKELSACLFASLYLAFFLSHLVCIRALPAPDNGAVLFMLLLCSVILNDTFAFATGRVIGKYCKHQMTPVISPAKTWEGFVGGMLGSLLFFLLAREFLPQVSDIKMLCLYLAVIIFAPLGDLVISVLKRETQVKDSSGMLPGHGGYLDRFDSLVLTAPVFYYIALI